MSKNEDVASEGINWSVDMGESETAERLSGIASQLQEKLPALQSPLASSVSSALSSQVDVSDIPAVHNLSSVLGDVMPKPQLVGIIVNPGWKTMSQPIAFL